MRAANYTSPRYTYSTVRNKLVFLGIFCVCPNWADVVVLKNGDRVTGSVVKKDGQSLTIKTEAFGVITATWDQVASVTTENPVTVELKTGDTVSGKLETAADKLVVRPEAAPPREASLADVNAVRDAAEQKEYERRLNPPWGRLWVGNLNFGLAGAQGNAETLTATLGINAARVTRTDKTAIKFAAIRSSALINNVNGTTANAVRGGWSYERNLGPRLFVNTFNDYEFDRFQNLDLRVVLGGGLGYVFWKTETSRFDISGGVAYNRESFASTIQSPAFTRNSAEAYVGNEFTLKVNATTSLFQTSRYFANLSNTGEYRLNFDLGATTRLTKWLQWNVSLSDRFLSNPVFGRQKNDFLYSTGVGITFSR